MTRRIAYVDGLRAIAVLGVVVHHIAKYDPSLPQGVLQHALLEGAHGVDLFFVLSGFCLSYPLLSRLQAAGSAQFDVVHYFARRLVRIVPPYYAAIGVSLALVWIAAQRLHWMIPAGMTAVHPSAVDLLKQMLFLDWRPNFVNGSFWTLAVEFRWYALFPLLLLLWTRAPRAFAFAAVAACLVGNLTRAAGYDLPILPAFMLGIAAADLEIRQRANGRTALLLVVLFACVALAAEPRYSAEFFRQNQPAWQLAAFFFVVASGCIPMLRAALSLRPLVAIGLASYSIYLVHEPMIGLLERNTVLHPAAVFAAALAAGFAFWLVFERPFVQTPLKQKAIHFVQPLVGRLFRFCGIPATASLGIGEPSPVALPDIVSTADASGAEAGVMTVRRVMGAPQSDLI